MSPQYVVRGDWFKCMRCITLAESSRFVNCVGLVTWVKSIEILEKLIVSKVSGWSCITKGRKCISDSYQVEFYYLKYWVDFSTNSIWDKITF